MDDCNDDVDVFTVIAEAWPVSEPSATGESAAIAPWSSSVQMRVATMKLFKLQLLLLWKIVAGLGRMLVVAVFARCWRCY